MLTILFIGRYVARGSQLDILIILFFRYQGEAQVSDVERFAWSKLQEGRRLAQIGYLDTEIMGGLAVKVQAKQWNADI